MSLPTARAEEAGLSPRRLALADDHVQRGHEEEVYTAAVLLVARGGRIAHQRAFGTLAPDGPPARTDSLFDLASLTKPHTAAAVLTLVEDGRVSLAGEVAEWIPETKGTPLASLTLRQLATHTSGLPAWRPLYRSGNRQAMLAEILATPLQNPPGTRSVYSDLGYILLGEVVARASGMPLDQYLHSRILAPLGMKDTGFLPAPTRRSRIAATANSRNRPDQRIVGEVHDENAHAFGGVAGHAGLFGTAGDLAILASALATDGEIGGHRVFGLPTLRLIRTSQVEPGVGGHSIGWFTPPNPMLPRGDLLPDTTFGHTGFTGTMVVVEPASQLVVILLTNRVINPADGTGIARVRRRVLNAVASAIVR